MKGTIIAAACAVLLLGTRSSALADEVFSLLGGSEQGSVHNLTFDGNADTELVWRRGWGGWRGGWGWRGGIGWRGVHRPFLGYPRFARPWRWGGWGYGIGVPYFYGGWGGSYYAPGFYYYGCSDAPSVVYSLDLLGGYNGVPAMPPMPPASDNGTFPYNGDPQTPAAQPAPPSIPAGQPRPKLPLKGQFVSLPKSPYLAYGETTAAAAPVAAASAVPQRYTYQAYGESRKAPATYRVSQVRP